MPTSSTTTSAAWDPWIVLDITLSSCVGKTQRGERCRNSMISYSDRARATQILDSMALHHPSSNLVRGDLTALAGLLLCPRWHRRPGYSQMSQMTSRWLIAIESHCAELQRAAVVAAEYDVLLWRSTVGPRFRYVEDVDHENDNDNNDEEEEEDEESEDDEDYNDDDNSDDDSSDDGSSGDDEDDDDDDGSNGGDEGAITPTRASQPAASSHSSSSNIILTPSTTSISGSNSQLPTPPATPESSRRMSPISITRIASSPASETLSTSTVSVPPPITPITQFPPRLSTSQPSRVRRRVRIDDCSICFDAIFYLEDAVWCQAQCGQNFHKECFELWEDICGSTTVKCAFCRTAWIYNDE